MIEGIAEGNYRYDVPTTSGKRSVPEALRADLQLCVSTMPEERPALSHLIELIREFDKGKDSSLAETMAGMLEEYSKNLEALVRERTTELMSQTAKVKNLLEELMPTSVANTLLDGKAVMPEEFECASVLFVDIVAFTSLCQTLTPMGVIEMLNNLYIRFDSIMRYRDVYKVETIGDAYFVASGLPIRNGNKHAGELCLLALEFMSVVNEFNFEKKYSDHSKESILDKKLQLRAGAHSGSLVAGIVGSRAPRYTVFGDTVNTGESHGELFACTSCSDIGFHSPRAEDRGRGGQGKERLYGAGQP